MIQAEELTIENSFTKSDLKRQRSNRRYNKHLNFSVKYTVFIITMWMAFVGTFIVGMIVHFKINEGITPSAILWTFSFILAIVALIYTIIYCTIRRNNTSEETRQKLLRTFPI